MRAAHDLAELQFKLLCDLPVIDDTILRHDIDSRDDQYVFDICIYRHSERRFVFWMVKDGLNDEQYRPKNFIEMVVPCNTTGDFVERYWTGSDD